MAERTLLCEIVTPERIVYTSEVRMVVAPTIDGEVGILPLHMPLVSVLAPGEVRVTYDDSEVEWFAVAGGYIQVHEDKVIILADEATASSQIDVERARRSLEMAQQRMHDLPSDDGPEYEECIRDLKWAEAQLKVGGKRG